MDDPSIRVTDLGFCINAEGTYDGSFRLYGSLRDPRRLGWNFFIGMYNIRESLNNMFIQNNEHIFSTKFNDGILLNSVLRGIHG